MLMSLKLFQSKSTDNPCPCLWPLRAAHNNPPPSLCPLSWAFRCSFICLSVSFVSAITPALVCKYHKNSVNLPNRVAVQIFFIQISLSRSSYALDGKLIFGQVFTKPLFWFLLSLRPTWLFNNCREFNCLDDWKMICLTMTFIWEAYNAVNNRDILKFFVANDAKKLKLKTKEITDKSHVEPSSLKPTVTEKDNRSL